MKLKEDETICDRCSKYEVSAGGCIEVCHAQKENNNCLLNYMDDFYVQERMSKEKTSCKAFKYIRRIK